jgi:hypothetical protein
MHLIETDLRTCTGQVAQEKNPFILFNEHKNKAVFNTIQFL